MQTALGRQDSVVAPAAVPIDLVRDGLRLVGQVVKPFRGRGLEVDDLVAEGRLGLLEAARRFDPARGTRFSTCAVPWIRKAIIDALGRQRRLVRVPGHAVTKVYALRHAERALAGSLGRPPSREETSRLLARPVREVERIMLAEVHVLPLDSTNGHPEGQPLSERLTDPRQKSPEEIFSLAQTCRAVRVALSLLQPRERQVVEERFGLAGGDERTLGSIGRDLGLSREAVRLIERRAMHRMRRALTGGGVGPGSRCETRPAGVASGK